MSFHFLSRPVAEKDYPSILALNDANVSVLAPMDESRIRYFKKNAEMFSVAEINGEPSAFIIVLRENLNYESENYRWFMARYPRFLYIDRIVIDLRFRKSGIGRMFYQEVIGHANNVKIPFITSEIDTEPVYNAASLKFHAAMGFKEVGTQYVRNGTMKVSLQALEIGAF